MLLSKSVMIQTFIMKSVCFFVAFLQTNSLRLCSYNLGVQDSALILADIFQHLVHIRFVNWLLLINIVMHSLQTMSTLGINVSIDKNPPRVAFKYFFFSA